MTSASELFYSRRSRLGREETELGFGSSLSSPLDRNYHLNHGRRRYHYRQQQQRRDTTEHRPPHLRQHLCDREHDSIRTENATSQPGTRNSRSIEVLHNRPNRLTSPHSDQLPGAVLLARERLVERLRGVSIAANRQNNRLSSWISLDESSYPDDLRHTDAADWDIQTSRERLAEVSNLFPDSSTRSSSVQVSKSKTATGLSSEEVDSLPQEFFSTEVESEVISEAVECSICLEKFGEGDKLICLPCRHRFHLACLNPWVRKCGDCPYCRTPIGHHHKPIN
ncbi:probable E3 ubiquitin-protein ligase RHY1A [Papaver somniferum]|uniref:probable E3 ubiquitin-protein ligase RHY1A n=1 Tax=Papaver somniferum TaxID=3469 RepID=UPI000E6F4C3D|nr:probable E3 ubiquitin-protein ligase RHY1A [Papaver somniferum]